MSQEIKECRLCARVSEECTSLFAAFDDEFSTYQDAVLYCTGLLLSAEDIYPRNICNECVKELIISVQFKKKCEITHALLQTRSKEVLENKPDIAAKATKRKYRKGIKTKGNSINDTNSSEDFIKNGVRTRSQKRKEIIVDDFGMISLKYKSKALPHGEETKTGIEKLKEELLESNENVDYPESEVKMEQSEDLFDAEDILASVTNYDDENTSELNDLVDSMEDTLFPEDTFEPKISDDTIGEGKEKQMTQIKIVDNKINVEKIPLSKIKDLAIKHFRDRGDSTFECLLCGRLLHKPQSRFIHYRTHLGPTHCDECDKEYDTPQQLITHLKMVHTGRVHVCHQCGKTYKRSTHLATHMRTHTGDKPHKCPHCGRGFTCKSILLPHIKCHLGVRDFICNICGIAKITSSELRFHMRIHKDTKPFKCDMCEYTAVSDYAVRRHARRHNPIKPFPCPHNNCPLTFTQAYDAKRHAEVHKSKSQKCEHCEKIFLRRDALRRHLVAEHDIQKPFKRKADLLIKGVKDGSDIFKTIRTLMRGRTEVEDKSVVEKLLKTTNVVSD